MREFFIFLAPVAAVIVLLIALKKGFNRQAFIVSAGITMVINMLLMERLSMYGFIFFLTVPLAVIYVVICLVLSLVEKKS